MGRLAFGRGYGGSTIYTGTSLIAPERSSATGRCRVSTTPCGPQPAMAENNVQLLDATRINDGSRLFVGLRRDRDAGRTVPVNLRGCKGSSLCNLGCPNAAKKGITGTVAGRRAARGGGHQGRVLRIGERSLTCGSTPTGRWKGTERGAPGDYQITASG